MKENETAAPPLDGMMETPLYVDDLDRARAFYEGVMGLSPLLCDGRMCAYPVARASMLLLFVRGASTEPIELPGGTIPPHDGAGPLHVALAISAAALPGWRSHLARHDIAIEGTVDWPRGGHSLYFRDPDGNLLELATPGLWEGAY